MNKIRVGETISEAYGFAFAGFLSVLGIIWLPYIVLAVLAGGVVYLIAPDLPGHLMRGEFDTPVLFEIARVYGIVWIFLFIARSMVTVGMQKKALGQLEGPTFFYFSLGSPVWQMVGALFFAFLTIIFIAVLTGCAVALIAFGAVKFIPAVGKALAAVAIVAGILWFIYACVRLMFFLPAVVVAENQVSLARSWELGAGNFWRIVAVLFVVFVPVAIGLGIVQHAFIGTFLPLDFFPHFHSGMTPDEVGQTYADIFKSLFQRMHHAWPVILIIGVIQTVLFTGLGNAAIAKAYLGVTGKNAVS